MTGSTRVKSLRRAAAVCLLVLCTPFAAVSPSLADETPAAAIPIAELQRTRPVKFSEEILPILRKNCLACHKAGEPEGELVLESPEAIRKGGEHGPAVIPGKAAESRLLKSAAHQAEPIMPPVDNTVGAEALTPEQLGLLKLWIDQGAQGETVPIARVIPRQSLPTNLQPILALAMTPDDELVACNRGEKLFIYDLRGPHLAAQLVDPATSSGGKQPALHEDLVRSLAFDSKGDLLASGGFRTVKLWRRPRTRLERELIAVELPTCVAVSADGRFCALGTAAGAIELHSLDGKVATKKLPGHDTPVTALAFAADGAQLYSAGADKTLRAWDAVMGKETGKFTTPAEIRSLAIVAGGKEIAAGSADNMIRIWPISAISSAEPPAPRGLKGHTQPIICLATVGPGGEKLASGSPDGTMRLWNVSTGEPQRALNHEAPIAAIAVSAAGDRLLSAGTNGVARLWNAADGAMVSEFKEDPLAVRAITKADAAVNYAKASIEYRKEEHREAQEQSKKESSVVEEANKAKTQAEKMVADKTESARKAVELRTAAQAKADEAAAALKEAADKKAAAQAAVDQAETGIKTATAAAQQAAEAAAKDKENKDLAAAREAAEKALADARASRKTLEAEQQKVIAAFRESERKHDEARRAASDARDKAKGPERELQEAKNVLQGAINFIPTATAVAERAKLAVPAAEQASKKAEMQLATAEADKKALVDAAKTKKQPLVAASICGAGSLIAVASASGEIRLFNAEHGASVEVVAAHSGPVVALASAADGQLISVGADKRVVIWQTADQWTLERTIGRSDEPGELVDRVLALDFSPDGKLLATGGGLAARSGQLKIWDVASGALVREIPGAARDTIYGVRYSPDGQLLATASADRLLKVFRVADGSLVRSFEGHTHHVLSVAWKPDGTMLATCGGDNVVKLWDFASGAPLRTMRGDTYQIGDYKREVTSIGFIGQTEHLVTSSGDRTVRMHRTSSSRDVKTFKEGASFMHAAVATSDGKLVVGGGRDGVLHIWNGESGYPVKALPPPSLTSPPATAAQAAK